MAENREEVLEATVTRVLNMMSQNGEILLLAELYRGTKDPDVRKQIEDALNAGIDRRQIASYMPSDGAHYWDMKSYDPLLTLTGMDGLPESTLIKTASVLGKLCRPDFRDRGLVPLRDVLAPILELAKRSPSENVKSACDDALVEAITSLPCSPHEDRSAAPMIADFRNEDSLSEKVRKACDDALVKIIAAWRDAGQPEQIINLVARHEGRLSSVVKDAAAAAVAGLNNIPEEEFIKALGVLAAVGELTQLVGIFSETTSPRTRQLIEEAMLNAMDVAVSDGWRPCGLNGASMEELKWTNQRPFEQVLQTGCSDAVKEKARAIIAQSGRCVNPPDAPEWARVRKMDEIQVCVRKINLYLLQERNRAANDVLSEGTVQPPQNVRGTSTPVPHRLPRNRLRCV